MQFFTTFFDTSSSGDFTGKDGKNIQTFPKILNTYIAFIKEPTEKLQVSDTMTILTT